MFFSLGRGAVQELQSIFCRSLSLFHQQRYAEAETLLRDGLERYDDDGQLRQLLGLVQNQTGAWQEALVSLERASHLRPLEPSADYTLAMCYLWAGKRELGVLVLRRLATGRRTPLNLLPMVASTLGSLQEHALALAACRNILRRDARRHDAQFGVGFYFRRLGLPRERYVAAFRRAHELAPRLGMYRIVLAGLVMEDGDDEEARDLLRGVSPAEVRCPGAVARLWKMFNSLGDSAAGAECLKRLEELEDNTDS